MRSPIAPGRPIEMRAHFFPTRCAAADALRRKSSTSHSGWMLPNTTKIHHESRSVHESPPTLRPLFLQPPGTGAGRHGNISEKRQDRGLAFKPAQKVLIKRRVRVDDKRLEPLQDVLDNVPLQFSNDFIFQRRLLRLADPDFVEHDLVPATSGDFLESPAQAKTKPPGIESIENDLPTDPVRRNPFTKSFRLTQPLRPRIRRGQTKALSVHIAGINGRGFLDVGIRECQQMTRMASRAELRGKSPGVVPHTVQAGLQATADEKNFQNLRTRVQTGMAFSLHILRGLQRLTSNKQALPERVNSPRRSSRRPQGLALF